jgi:hypothetical protein
MIDTLLILSPGTRAFTHSAQYPCWFYAFLKSLFFALQKTIFVIAQTPILAPRSTLNLQPSTFNHFSTFPNGLKAQHRTGQDRGNALGTIAKNSQALKVRHSLHNRIVTPFHTLLHWRIWLACQPQLVLPSKAWRRGSESDQVTDSDANRFA